jgi:hypothetical protein
MTLVLAVASPEGVLMAVDHRSFRSTADIRERRPPHTDQANKITGFRWDRDCAALVGHTGMGFIRRETSVSWVNKVSRSFDGASANDFADYLRQCCNADIAPLSAEKQSGHTFIVASVFHGAAALHRVALRVVGGRFTIGRADHQTPLGSVMIDGSGSISLHASDVAETVLRPGHFDADSAARIAGVNRQACRCPHRGYMVSPHCQVASIAVKPDAPVASWRVCGEGNVTHAPGAKLMNARHNPLPRREHHGR